MLRWVGSLQGWLPDQESRWGLFALEGESGPQSE